MPGVFLALSAGILVFGEATWIVGWFAGTRWLPLAWLVLLAASLRRTGPFLRAVRRVLRRLVLLSRATPAVAGLLGAGLLALVPVLLLPLMDSDGIRYHVALPRLFLLEGRISYYPWDITGALPQTVEMLYLCGLVLGSAEASKWLHAAFFVLCLVTVALAVHRGRRTRTAALVAASFLLLAPVAAIPATAAFTDHAATFAIATAVLWLLRSTPAAWAGVPLALSLSTKLTTGPAVAALLLAVPALSARGRRWGAFLLSSGAVTLAYAPFGVRNFLATGDPFFPVGRALLGLPIPGVSAESLSSVTRYRSIGTGPLGLAWWEGVGGAASDDVVGLPFLLSLFLLPVLVADRRMRVLLLPVLAYAAVGLAIHPPARFLMPAFWALAAVAALGLSRLPSRVGLALALLLAAPGAVTSARFLLSHSRAVDHLRGTLSREAVLASSVPGYRAARRLASLPPGRVMALDFPAAFYLPSPWVLEGILDTPPLKTWLREGDDADRLERRLHALRIRYLLVTPGYGGGSPVSLLALTRPDDVRGVTVLKDLRARLVRVDTVDGVDIYELPARAESP